MCYVNFDNLITISKNKRVRGVPNLKELELCFCKQCQIGKMSKRSFKSKSFNFEEVLELAHIDFCGPIGIKSYCGDIYFILFVDDYSRMMIVIFLKDKYNIFQKFKWYLG